MKDNPIVINIILDKLRRSPLLSDLSFETVVDYTVEFMEIEGFPAFFEEKTATLTVSNYKAELPIDFSEIIAVRGNLTNSSNDRKISYRKATDLFMLSKNKGSQNDYTYKIQGKMIYTSLENGDIDIVYSAFKTDPFGFPMIPENSKFFVALMDYIKVKHFTNLFEQGKLDPRILDHAEREYCWSVGACESEFHKLSYDEAESLGNQWRQVIINTNEHLNGYLNIGIKKDLKIK